MPWKDPLLEALAKGTQSTLDRPPLHRPRLGRVGFVPDGAIDCTLAEIAQASIGRLHERLRVPANRTLRVAYNLNLFDWRPWGMLTGINATAPRQDSRNPDYYRFGSVSIRHPLSSMGHCMILGGEAGESMDDYRAWIWTLDTERDEGVYLTRRQPRTA